MLRSSIANRYAECLIDWVERLYELAREKEEGLSKDNFTIILLAKTAGETQSQRLAALTLASHQFNCAVLCMDVFYENDYRLSGEIKGKYLIVIDDVATRGLGVRQVREILSKLTSAKILQYGVLLLRGDPDRAAMLDVYPLATTVELAGYGLWIPELSMVSLSNPYWHTIDLRQNLLGELFTFHNAYDRYHEFISNFTQLLRKYYSINSSNDEAILFKKEIGISYDELRHYLMNMHVLLWNYIYETYANDLEIKPVTSVDLLEIFLVVEEMTGLTLEPASKFINQVIDSLPEPLAQWDYLHATIVENLQTLLEKVNDKYLKVRNNIYMPIKKSKKTYTEEEIREIIDTQIRILKQNDEMRGRKYWTLERLEDMRKLYYEMFQLINKYYGKIETAHKEWLEWIRECDEKYKKFRESQQTQTSI
jgi:hypothetical protein